MRFLFSLLLSLGSSALAVESVGNVLYTRSQDPITDTNTSRLTLYEINDTTSSTSLDVICRAGQGDVFLSTKNPLYSAADARTGNLPSVQYRVDQQDALTESATASVITDGKPDNTGIAFSQAADARLLQAMNGGQSRVVFRVLRKSNPALTYIFSLNGFQAAWNAIGGCRTGQIAAAPATSSLRITPPATASAPRVGAPKFNLWTFTSCVDTQTGEQRNYLYSGSPQRCTLVIDTVPNGNRPVQATFQYELSYTDASTSGTTQKLKLRESDTWSASGGGSVSFAQNGAQLRFTLPLNVRYRTDRTYTSIGVIGTVVFEDGSSKRIYEPLEIR